MEKYVVKAIDLKSSTIFDLEIDADEGETSELIVLNTHVNGQQITSSDYYYFPAFQKLRDKLLEMGYGIKCNGSRLNAVQSEMMGAIEKVYLVTLGVQAFLKDAVCLYDFSDVTTFPNTAEQSQFVEKWMESLKS